MPKPKSKKKELKLTSPSAIQGGRFTRPSWDNGRGISVPLTPEKSITTDLLAKLRLCRTTQQALRLLRKEHPDISMAVWNFLRLANLGHEMKIYSLDGKRRLKRAENKWNNEVAPRLYAIANNGLDGLIDRLHLSALIDGAMAVEGEASQDLNELIDAHWVDPMTIEWRPEERNGRKILIPYQRQPGYTEPVSLEKANFYWVPVDPDGDTPIGNPPLSAAVTASDAQMQILLDMHKVLHNQGWPRYDISIELEKVVSSMPPEARMDPEKQREYLMAKLTEMERHFSDLKPDDSFVHYDDTTIQMANGANNGSRGIDVRGINEGMDTQLMSGAKQMAIFVNRNQGVTETWGSVQFRIFCSGIKSVQRGSKRIIEDVARLTLRLWGVQGRPQLTFNELDHESEKARLEIDNARAQYWAFCQQKGWVDKNEAAENVVGHEATGTPEGGGSNDGDDGEGSEED